MAHSVFVLATPVMQEAIRRLLGVVATEGENNKRRQTLLTAYAAPSRDDHWRNLNMTGSFRDFLVGTTALLLLPPTHSTATTGTLPRLRCCWQKESCAQHVSCPSALLRR